MADKSIVPGDENLVSIVLPCFNEQKALAKVTRQIREAMDASEYEYEILVVDDASTDRTPEIAEKLGLRIVRHKTNRGSGAARRTGILNARGAIIVMLDADGTYEPKTIPEMLSHFPEYEQVNGARTSEEGTMKPLRYSMKWVLRRLAIYISGHHIPDLNTGLKAFRRDTMIDYLWVLPDGFSCVTSMTLAFLANGHPVKYVDTPYYKRIGKSKFHPVKDTANYLATILRVMTFFRPLRVYMPVAFVMVTVGILKGIFDVFFLSKHSLQESDIILVCVGVLMGAIGLLAELIVAQARR